uniref:AlNc14C3G514 protein n=1 Tax=Albugo laibachii Nc14 TaxID=890382 RepID=F0W046_9STRA|nr:AlNc14C3G514 [Albugo laibachii Nc14]|eukprot:CCA14417.1 AlNc14C3G514 [Albugo laibachii Nc14]
MHEYWFGLCPLQSAPSSGFTTTGFILACPTLPSCWKAELAILVSHFSKYSRLAKQQTKTYKTILQNGSHLHPKPGYRSCFSLGSSQKNTDLYTLIYEILQLKQYSDMCGKIIVHQGEFLEYIGMDPRDEVSKTMPPSHSIALTKPHQTNEIEPKAVKLVMDLVYPCKEYIERINDVISEHDETLVENLNSEIYTKLERVAGYFSLRNKPEPSSRPNSQMFGEDHLTETSLIKGFMNTRSMDKKMRTRQPSPKASQSLYKRSGGSEFYPERRVTKPRVTE